MSILSVKITAKLSGVDFAVKTAVISRLGAEHGRLRVRAARRQNPARLAELPWREKLLRAPRVPGPPPFPAAVVLSEPLRCYNRLTLIAPDDINSAIGGI